MPDVEVANRFSLILFRTKRTNSRTNPASPDKLQLIIHRFHAILYRVHGMEPEHLAVARTAAHSEGARLRLFPGAMDVAPSTEQTGTASRPAPAQKSTRLYD